MTLPSHNYQIREITEYKGFLIQKNTEAFQREKFLFHRSDQEIDHDCDSDGVDFIYVGNCKFCDSIEEAKDRIDDMIAEQMPPYTVEMNGRNYTWKWLSDAIGFAGRFNGELSVQFTNP